VDALKGLGVLVEVASAARFCLGDGEIAGRIEVPLGMLGGGKAEVAVEASELGMDRPFQHGLIDLQGDLLPVPQSDAHGVLVALQAVVLLGDELLAAGNGCYRVGIVAARAYRGLVLLRQERRVDRGFLQLLFRMALAAHG